VKSLVRDYLQSNRSQGKVALLDGQPPGNGQPRQPGNPGGKGNPAGGGKDGGNLNL
jgi:hypothetical protein